MNGRSIIPVSSSSKAIKVICPCCWQIYDRIVEFKYINDPEIWRENGYLCILCDDCSKSKIKKGDRNDDN